MLAALLFAACALRPAQAAEPALRSGHYYERAAWDLFPDAAALAQVSAASWSRFLPNLDPRALLQISYQESSFTRGHNLCALGLRGNASTQLSLIYYSADGHAYLIRRGLPLPRSGRLFAELELPASERQGLIRALLWDQQPDLEVLATLLERPLSLSPAVPGVIGQSWILRAAPGALSPPWQNPLSLLESPPLGFEPRAWPLLYARLDSGGQPVLKDCVLSYDGAVTPDPRDYSAYAWPLSWGDELLISFAIPPDREGGRAELRLDFSEELSSATSQPAEGELQIEVNGWSTSQMDFAPAFDSLAQPAGLAVSHYLRPGVNQLRLRAPAQAGKSWLIRRVELWMN